MSKSIVNSLALWTEKILRLSRVFIRFVVNLIKHPRLRLAYHINRAGGLQGYDSLAVIESLSAGRAVKESELAVKICNCGPDLIKSWALQGGTWGRWGGTYDADAASASLLIVGTVVNVGIRTQSRPSNLYFQGLLELLLKFSIFFPTINKCIHLSSIYIKTKYIFEQTLN